MTEITKFEKKVFDYLNDLRESGAFKDEQTRDLFLKNFKDLIIKARPLLG